MNTMKAAIASLKETVKRGTDESRQIRSRIDALRKVPDTGQERSNLWDDKRALKHTRRYELLAYGALRGVAYAKMEADGGSTPYAPNIFSLLAGLADKDDVVMSKWNNPKSFSFLDEREGETVEWTHAKVEAWLNGEEKAQEVAA